jgi:pSer/pThr/pTyr-binding forkhead associated (FHA) protein
MPPRRPDPRQSAPPKPRKPRAPTQEIPEDLDEEVQQELGGRSAEEIYGDAYPEEEEPRSRVNRPAAGESTRYAAADDLEEEEERAPEPSPDSTFAGPPVKLEVISGPDEGNVRRFRGVRMVLGRGKGVDFELTDQSVSRRHVELVYGEEKGVLLRDLNSTTGTKVNGERVAERILAHLDEILIGRTHLRFVDEMVVLREREEKAKRAKEEAEAAAKADAEARAKAEAEAKALAEDAAIPGTVPGGLRPVYAAFQKLTPVQQRTAMLAGGALVLFLFAGVMFALFHRSGPPPPSPNDLIANKKYELAHVAITDGRFDDAVNLVESAERVHPGIDVDGLLAQAKTDLAAQQSMDAAKQLIDQQHFEDARAELARTPQGTDDEVRRHQDLVSELDERQTQFLVHGAQEAIAQGNYSTASEVIAAVNNDSLRKQLKAQLEDAKTHHEESVALAEKHKREAAEDAAKREKQARVRHFEEAFGPVARKLESGDYDRAMLECDRAGDKGDKETRAKAKDIKMLIPVFQREYEDGLRKAAAGSPELSVRPLRKAKKLYDEMGLETSLGHKIDHALALAALSAAKTALGRDDLASAVLSYKEALSLEASNAEAKSGMNQLVKKTDQLLLDAYVQRDRDPRGAIEKLKMVMEIAPAGSANYDKAKSQLQVLQP